MWIVELEAGVWISNFGEPHGQTLVEENALKFESMEEAGEALTVAREYRPFKNAAFSPAPDR